MADMHTPWRADPDDRPGMEYNNHIVNALGERLCFMANGGPERQAEFDEIAALIAKAWMLPDLEAAARDVVTNYPLIHGEPVPAWIRNLAGALKQCEEQ